MQQTAPSPARTGDTLVIEIQRLARRFAAKRVPSETADDIAQDVVLECLVKLRAGQWTVRHKDLSDFVRKVVRRRIADWLRRCDRERARNVEYAHELEERECAWMSPEQEYEARELEAVREQTLNELPEACRRAYLLVREEGESYERVAERLGVTRSMVSAHVVKAQRRFRRALGRRERAR